MMVSQAMTAKIIRLFYVEHFTVHYITKITGKHHTTVKRILAQADKTPDKAKDPLPHPSKLTPYVPFIQSTFEKYPTLCSSRLYDMVKDRGYVGSQDYFRHYVARFRPKPAAEAYHRLVTLPGEQAQVDWGHFGHITIGNAKRPLMAFVMVLSFSRKLYLQFFLNAQLANFMRGHEAAFNAWGGVPRVILTDNLSSVTLDREGDAIRYNPNMLAFASHYHYELRPVAVARGNQKGRVERSIRFIRDNFFAARSYRDVDDLNRQAALWTDHISERPCPDQPALSVQEAFLLEKPRLLALPNEPYPAIENVVVRIQKQPYARFDKNDYSVPHTCVQKNLTASATLNHVSFLDGTEIVATHDRSYDTGKTIESPAHIAGLTAAKRKARCHQRQHFLTRVTPFAEGFLDKAAQRGYALHGVTARLIDLLSRYGLREFEYALQESLQRDVPHPNAVRFILEQRRETQQKPPALMLPITTRKQAPIRPHDLKTYDEL